jgi:hypothetical protein
MGVAGAKSHIPSTDFSSFHFSVVQGVVGLECPTYRGVPLRTLAGRVRTFGDLAARHAVMHLEKQLSTTYKRDACVPQSLFA